MAKIETNISNITDGLKGHIKDQREDFDKVFEKLDNLNKLFAAKWVEKVSVGVLVSIIAGIVIFIIKSIR